MKRIPKPSRREQIDLFRLSVIGDLLAQDLVRGDLKTELEKRAQKRYRPPEAENTRMFDFRGGLFAVPLRFPLIKDRSLLSAVLRIFIDVVFKHLRNRSGAGVRGRCGAVAAIHRSDSSLSVNPHFHVIFLDGAYEIGDDAEQSPIFRRARPDPSRFQAGQTALRPAWPPRRGRPA